MREEIKVGKGHKLALRKIYNPWKDENIRIGTQKIGVKENAEIIKIDCYSFLETAFNILFELTQSFNEQ